MTLHVKINEYDFRVTLGVLVDSWSQKATYRGQFREILYNSKKTVELPPIADV
ncbi:hypothetical protein [Flexibacter flexilis]|uniref:hypothetical protein n=1 Tax=Flexibacter flexilis TaxID=998 RepID=UPI001C86766C|nr:hypothetical protein [Flexibacter flexilis]